MELYRGRQVNSPGDPPPWGLIDNGNFKWLIDQALDHRHSSLYDSTLVTKILDIDTSGLSSFTMKFPLLSQDNAVITLINSAYGSNMSATGTSVVFKQASNENTSVQRVGAKISFITTGLWSNQNTSNGFLDLSVIGNGYAESKLRINQYAGFEQHAPYGDPNIELPFWTENQKTVLGDLLPIQDYQYTRFAVNHGNSNLNINSYVRNQAYFKYGIKLTSHLIGQATSGAFATNAIRYIDNGTGNFSATSLSASEVVSCFQNNGTDLMRFYGDGSLRLFNQNTSHNMSAVAPPSCYGSIYSTPQDGGMMIDGFSDSTSDAVVMRGIMKIGCAGPACIKFVGAVSDNTGWFTSASDFNYVSTFYNNSSLVFGIFGNGMIKSNVISSTIEPTISVSDSWCIWRNTTNNKIYLVFRDTSANKKVELV